MKCAHCPVDPATPCLAERDARFTRTFCAWAPDPIVSQRAMIVDRSELPPPVAAVPRAAVPQVPPEPDGLHPVLPQIMLAGDVVEAIAKRIGADRLAKWWERATGTPCGCSGRKEAMNRASAKLLKWAGMSPPPDPEI